MNNSKVIASLEIATASGLLLWWVLVFTLGMAPDQPPIGWLSYSRSFVLPDVLLSVLLFWAGILLLRGRPLSIRLSAVAAGALLFLGILDFSYNMQNGMYAGAIVDTILNAFINIWCAGLGLAIVLSMKSNS
jgi:hypothetical protein